MHPLQQLLSALVLIFLIEEFIGFIIGLWPGDPGDDEERRES